MADLLSIRKVMSSEKKSSMVFTEKESDNVKIEDCQKRGKFHFKKFCKLLRPTSKRCVYEILKKALSQSKILNKERFRWIRRVRFILNDVSEVHEYVIDGSGANEECDKSKFQDIVLLINEENGNMTVTEDSFQAGENLPKENEPKDVSAVPKLISYNSIASIDSYVNFKSNIRHLRHSSVSYQLEDYEASEKEMTACTNKSFDGLEGDIELLLTKYFDNAETE